MNALQAHELAERDFKEYGKLASLDGTDDAGQVNLEGAVPVQVHNLLEEMRQNASQQVHMRCGPRTSLRGVYTTYVQPGSFIDP